MHVFTTRQNESFLGTGRCLRENLIWLRGFYSDGGDEASVEQDRFVIDPRVTRLLLCSPEDADSIWFWRCLEDPFLGQCIAPSSTHHDLLNRYIPERHDGKTPLQLAAVAAYFALLRDDLQLLKYLESFITAIIATGAGPHDGDHHHTPLLLLLAASSGMESFPYGTGKPRDMRLMLVGWIEILQHAGLDLTSYGAEETRQHLAYRALADPVPQLTYWHNTQSEMYSNEVFYFTFSYGPTPKEWSVQLDHRVDQYVNDFWQMPGLLDDSEVRVVPGAWVDEE